MSIWPQDFSAQRPACFSPHPQLLVFLGLEEMAGLEDISVGR